MHICRLSSAHMHTHFNLQHFHKITETHNQVATILFTLLARRIIVGHHNLYLRKRFSIFISKLGGQEDKWNVI